MVLLFFLIKLVYYFYVLFVILVHDTFSFKLLHNRLFIKFFNINDEDFGFGTIGCKFEAKVCRFDEICFDDDLFGICQKHQTDHLLFTSYSLSQNNLGLLALEMAALLMYNYSWHDAYAQCVIKNVLLSSCFSLQYHQSICKIFDGKNVHAAAKVSLKNKLSNNQHTENINFVMQITLRQYKATGGLNMKACMKTKNSAILSINKSGIFARMAEKLRHVHKTFGRDFNQHLKTNESEMFHKMSTDMRKLNNLCEHWIWAELDKAETITTINSESLAFVNWLDHLLHPFIKVKSFRWRGNTLFVCIQSFNWINGTLFTAADIVSKLKNGEWRPPGLQIARSGFGHAETNDHEKTSPLTIRPPQAHSFDLTPSQISSLLIFTLAFCLLFFLFLIYYKRGCYKSASSSDHVQGDIVVAYPQGTHRIDASRRSSHFQLNVASDVFVSSKVVAINTSNWHQNIVFFPNKGTANEAAKRSTVHIDIGTSHLLLQYLEGFVSDKNKLHTEWQKLCMYESHVKSARSLTSHDGNNDDESRINASSIFDETLRSTYIMSEGARRGSVLHWWNMIWDNDIDVIVNLEHAKECARIYWPAIGLQIYGHYEVHVVSQHLHENEDYLVRSFYMKNLRSGETRTVTQFHFVSWFEWTTPNVKSLLQFRRLVKSSFRAQHTPLLVHCSDGNGRSGTYLLIDMLLNRISKGVREINFAVTLQFLRDQRPNAVKNMNQFEFVFIAVAHEINHALNDGSNFAQ